MLSGGMAGQFSEPSQGKPTKMAKPWLAPKVSGLSFSTFPVFGDRLSDHLPYFWRSGPHLPQGLPNMGYTWAQILLTVYFKDLMVAYLTDTRCWLQWTSKRGYVIWQVKNLVLNPGDDCIHDCIQDWTHKWDPSLMKSTAWPMWPPMRPGISHVWDVVGVGRVQGVLVRE